MKLTLADALPLVADTDVGALGTVAGVTAVDADEAADDPSAFAAFTVNVYAVPFVNPVTFNGELAPVAVSPPGLEVTV